MTVLHWENILPKYQVEKGVKCHVGDSHEEQPPQE